MCGGRLALCSEPTFELTPLVHIQAFPLNNYVTRSKFLNLSGLHLFHL